MVLRRRPYKSEGNEEKRRGRHKKRLECGQLKAGSGETGCYRVICGDQDIARPVTVA